MPTDNPKAENVTLLLKQMSSGNQDVIAQLVPMLYNELRRLAGHYLRAERPNHTLQPTALVHEAYLRLIEQNEVEWKNRGHFFAVAAQQMRRILVDYARSHRAAKRGGSTPKIPLDLVVAQSPLKAGDIVELDQVLARLSSIDPQQSRVVELRVFGGLTVEEVAEILHISPATVKRDWSMAKAWLIREMGRRLT
jgi:RNA polymerase sigma-70 factor, ECF subfamily